MYPVSQLWNTLENSNSVTSQLLQDQQTTKLKENLRYSTYAEKEEEDYDIIRDEDLMLMDHNLSQHRNFSDSNDDDEEFEDRLMQNTDEVVIYHQR